MPDNTPRYYIIGSKHVTRLGRIDLDYMEFGGPDDARPSYTATDLIQPIDMSLYFASDSTKVYAWDRTAMDWNYLFAFNEDTAAEFDS